MRCDMMCCPLRKYENTKKTKISLLEEFNSIQFFCLLFTLDDDVVVMVQNNDYDVVCWVEGFIIIFSLEFSIDWWL